MLAGLALGVLLVVGLVAAAVWLRDDPSSWTFSISENDPTLPPTVLDAHADLAAPTVRRRAVDAAERDELFRRLTRHARPRLVASL
jgi:hypothetical protein